MRSLRARGGAVRSVFWTLIWIFLPPGVLLLLGQLLLQGGTPSRLIAGSILSLIGSIVSIPASLALINAVAHGTDFAMSYRVGMKLFWPAIGIIFLNLFAVIGGYILLIVPGIMLSIALMFGSYALVVEDKRGMRALAQSRNYVSGYWWAVLGRTMLLGGIFTGAIL